MINNNTKKEILDRIIKSEEFANSQVYQKLLIYLVNASIENRSLKEYTIALEFFNKGTDYNSTQDTIVRVHIYNLRKKLESYYNKEGKAEKLRIHIPRGHYEISFSQANSQGDSSTIKQYKIIITTLLVLLLLSNGILLQLLKKSNTNREQSLSLVKQAIWSDFFTSPKEKMVVLGDHFFFVQHAMSPTDRTLLRRDDINSLEDFNNYRKDHPELIDSWELPYPLFPKNSIWPFIDLLYVFNKLDIDYIPKYTSSVTATDIKNYNSIFVGSFHTLGAFGKMFSNSNFSYTVYPNKLIIKDKNSNDFKEYIDRSNPNDYHTDYGIVRKIPGPDKTIIFIFTSFHDTGTIGIIKYFTDPKSLAELEELFIKKYHHVPEYFEIFFKASGYNRTAYKTEIDSVYEIKPETPLW
ncbi:MAG TPA: hypothetical protein PLP19_19375 [bacterium]|nr:hypothetical protein [bacterium]HPN45658.1 hypothetical protein [bacterium]